MTLRKACSCNSSASGPRMVSAQVPQPDGSLSVRLMQFRLVCDACDTPWSIDGRIEGWSEIEAPRAGSPVSLTHGDEVTFHDSEAGARGGATLVQIWSSAISVGLVRDTTAARAVLEKMLGADDGRRVLELCQRVAENAPGDAVIHFWRNGGPKDWMYWQGDGWVAAIHERPDPDFRSYEPGSLGDA